MKKILFFLFILPGIIQAQVIRADQGFFNLSGTQQPAAVPTLSVSGSLSAFSSAAGQPPIAQKLFASGFALIDSGVLAAPIAMEISLDSMTFSNRIAIPVFNSALIGQPIAFFCRTAGATSAGSYTGNFTLSSVGATTFSVPFSATVTSSAVITVTGTMGAFVTTTGTASPADSVTVSGAGLTANIIATWPTAFEGSLDKTTWASTRTFTRSGGTLPGQPVKAYTRLAAGASTGSPSGNVSFTSTGATTVNKAVSGTVNPPATAIFNFSLTSDPQAGSTNFTGDPTTVTPISATDATTHWTIAAIPAGWTKFAGSFYGGVGNGCTVASSDGTFTQGQINSNLYTNSAFSSSGYQLQFTNLPAGTYEISVLGSLQPSIATGVSGSDFHVQFGTGSDNVSSVYNANGNPVPAGNLPSGNITTTGPGTTGIATGSFTGTITAGQVIKIGFGFAPASFGTGFLGIINAVKIKKD